MRIHFVINRRVPPVPSPVLLEAYARLRAAGHHVTEAIPEETLSRPDRDPLAADLYVVKSHTELAFSLAGTLHAAGARMLNPYPAWVATQDKLVASRHLRQAEVPVPRSWTTADLDLLHDLVRSGPLIIKPHRGHRGAGIRIVHGPDELAALPEPSQPVIVQDFLPGPGEDLKVYVVGEEVFGVRKPFSATSFSRPGRACRLDDEVVEIARRCGQVLGLGLYGLDVIETDDGPHVVDVNTFPGYKGVDGAARRLAAYIAAYAAGEVALPAPGRPVVAGAT